MMMMTIEWDSEVHDWVERGPCRVLDLVKAALTGSDEQ